MSALLILLTILAAAPEETATVTMAIALQRPEHAWRVTLELRSLRDGTTTTHEQPWSSVDLLQKQSIAPGAYELTVSAAQHRPVTRRIVAAPGETVSLGAITLTAFPRILGRVTANGAPVANATIRTTEPPAETKTDPDGRFVLEISSPRPRYLIAEAPRLGTRIIDLPQASSDLTLPPIELETPSSVEVAVRRPRKNLDPLEVLVGTKGRSGFRWIARRDLGPRDSKATFATLAPGTYTLLVRGRQPMQQLASKLVLGHDDHRKTIIAIEPFTVEARVLMGGEPVANATAILLDTDESSMVKLTTDAAGRWKGEVWQRGTYVARVTSPAMQAAAAGEAKIDGAHVVIELPALTVRGRVLDARTGEPVRSASLSLRSFWDDNSASVPLQSDAGGRFAFRGVPAGQQQLTVRAPGYLLHERLEFDLSPDAPLYEVDVRLDPGVRKEIDVIDGRGSPVPNAMLFCGEAELVWSTAPTNERGRGVISLPTAGCTLYVIPDSTSFAVTRVTPAMVENPAARTVSIGSNTGRLEVVTQTDQGHPVSGVRLLVRYNGEIVPADVVRVLERMQGLAFRTDGGGVATLPALPLGTYELWPYRTDDEAARILAAGMFEAPIHLTLKTGENRVAVKLRRR